jgi:hypothetical protein
LVTKDCPDEDAAIDLVGTAEAADLAEARHQFAGSDSNRRPLLTMKREEGYD